MKYASAFLIALAFVASASAQHKHGDRGPNGGPMEDVAGVVAELVVSGTTVTLHVYDESTNPVATTGFTASALIVSGPDRETVSFAPSGANSLYAQVKKPVGTRATVTITLKTGAGRSGQAKFQI
jgi:hypothetical protein